jgi:RHS repeat-associated protein
VNAPAGAITYESDVTYSPGGRIITARVDSSGAGPDVMERDVTYEYTGPAPQADPAAVRRLAPQPGGGSPATFDYDERGNLTRKVHGTEQRDFIHDGDDLIREVTDGTSREVYYYDHNGQRSVAWSSSWSGQSAKLRFWFGDTEIEYSTNASPPPVKETAVFARLGAMPVARIRRTSANTAITLLYSGVLNHLLAVLNTTNSAPVAQFGYGPFGEQLYAQGPAAADYHRLYNGEEHDEFTSLSYYGARYYDRLTLTWTQFDPLYRLAPDLAWDEPRRGSLYSFSLNNPLRYIDPDGLDPAKEPKNLGPWEDLKKQVVSYSRCTGVTAPKGKQCAFQVELKDGTIWSILTEKGGTAQGIPAEELNFIQSVVRERTGLSVSPDTLKAIEGAMILSAIVAPAAGLLKKAAGKIGSLFSRGAAAGGPKLLGPGTSIGSKIEKQMAKRGWNREAVDKLIANPHSTRAVRDTRHSPSGVKVNDPATAYINRQGHYVIRNNRTGDVVQVSNRHDLDWVSPWD